MKHLYVASDNVMIYLVIRDVSLGENDTAVVNWDLSADEIADAVSAFKNDENSTEFYACEPEFESFTNVMSRMTDWAAL